MKKLLAVVLALAMMLCCPVPALSVETDGYITRAQAIEMIIEALYGSSGCEGFLLEENYCVHPSTGGFAHFVPAEFLPYGQYPLLCEIYSSSGVSEFTDIPDDERLMLYVALAKGMGITQGYGDGTFRPDRRITYNEAVKMLVCAFEDAEPGEALGGYPQGYILAAEELGITRNVSFDGQKMVDAGSFDLMIRDALEIPYTKVNNLMLPHVPPDTAEQCVEVYAEAVKNRNGGVQFALLSEELKAALRQEFVDLRWVTGVSSPWITGYIIEQLGPALYRITFNNATSTGPSEDTQITLTVEPVAGTYRITDFE